MCGCQGVSLSIGLIWILFGLSLPNLIGGGVLRTVGSNDYGQLGFGQQVRHVELQEIVSSGVVLATAGAGTAHYRDDNGDFWGLGWLWLAESDFKILKKDIYEPLELPEAYNVFPAETFTFFGKSDGELLASGWSSSPMLSGFERFFSSSEVVMSGVESADHSRSVSAFVMIDGRLLLSNAYQSEVTGIDREKTKNDPDLLEVAQGVSKALVGEDATIILRRNGDLEGIGAYYSTSSVGIPTPEPINSDVVDFGLVNGGPSVVYLKNDGSLWIDSVKMVNENVTSIASYRETYYIDDEDRLWRADWFKTALNGGSRNDPQTWEFTQVASNVAMVSAYIGTTLVVTNDGRLLGEGQRSPVFGREIIKGGFPAHTIDSSVEKVFSGVDSQFYIKEDGSLWGIGANAFYEIGVPNQGTYSSPVEIMSSVSDVVSGNRETFVLDTEGRLWGMGHFDLDSEGGSVVREHPTPTLIDSNVQSIDSNFGTSLVFIKQDDSMWILGQANTTAFSGIVTTPVRVGSDIAQVSDLNNGLLWLDLEGDLYAEGRMAEALSSSEPDPTPPAGGSKEPIIIAEDVIDAQARKDWDSRFGDLGGTGLFLKSDGSLWGIGEEFRDVFSSANGSYAKTPVLISNNVASFSVGSDHILYLKNDGSFWFKGEDSYGKGGFLPVDPNAEVVRVFEGEEILAFSAGNVNSMVVTASSEAPSITGQPQDVSIILGESGQLQVEAENGLLSYQWFKGAKGDRSYPLMSQNAPALEVEPYGSSQYWVEIENGHSTIESEAATVSVDGGLSGGYHDWINWWEVPPSDAAFDLDPDGDQRINRVEYVFSSDPYSSFDDYGFDFRVINGEWRVAFPFQRNLDEDVSIDFQLSTDLEDWTDYSIDDIKFPDPLDQVGWLKTAFDPNDQTVFLKYELILNE